MHSRFHPAAVAISCWIAISAIDARAQDTMPPAPFDLIAPANGGWCSGVCRFDWHNSSDNVGVSRYVLYVNGAVKKDNIAPESSEYTLSIAEALTEGPPYSWFVQACDASGNCRDSINTRSFSVDATAPAPFDLLYPAADEWRTSRRTFEFSWSASSDSRSGIQKYDLLIDGVVRATRSADQASVQSSTVMFPITTLASGAHTWTIVAQDAVGNVRTAVSRTLRMDNELPVYPTGTISPAPGTWINTRYPTFQWTAPTDGGSGVVAQRIGLDPGDPVNMDPYFDLPQSDCMDRPPAPGDLQGGRLCESAAWTAFAVYSPTWLNSFDGRSGVTRIGTISIAGFHLNPAYVRGRTALLPTSLLSLRLVLRSEGDADEDVLIRSAGQSWNVIDQATVGGTTWHEFETDVSSFHGENAYVEMLCRRVGVGNTCYLDELSIRPMTIVHNGLAGAATEFLSPAAGQPLADGQHQWRVYASDQAGNVGASALIDFGVDTTPPTGLHLSGNNGTMNGAIVSFPTPDLCWTTPVDAGSGVDEYRLYIDGAINRSGIPATSQCTTPTVLTEGPHTWHVSASDAVGNTALSDEVWTVIYDISPPAAFQRISPADGASIADARPTFSWQSSSDAAAGIDRYELWIDDNAGGPCAPCSVTPDQTSFSPPVSLSLGPHTWFVRAVDRAGYATQTDEGTFGILATPTGTQTETGTATPSAPATGTHTPTAPATSSGTPTVSRTPTPTVTRAPTAGDTLTPTPIVSVTHTLTSTSTPTIAVTASATGAASPTPSTTPSVGATITPSPTPTSTPALTCAGDCDGDLQVTISELIRAVNVTLGSAQLAECQSLDRNQDGAASISELIQAVNGALFGCFAT